MALDKSAIADLLDALPSLSASGETATW